MDHLGSSAWLEAAPEILNRHNSNNPEILTAVSLALRLLSSCEHEAEVEPCISGAAIHISWGAVRYVRSQGSHKVESTPLCGRNPRARYSFLMLLKYSPKRFSSSKAHLLFPVGNFNFTSII